MAEQKNIWQICKFSDEIYSANLELYKFAVELHEFLDGQADPVYLDPELFFENTFLTNQMKGILKDVIIRLDRGSGPPVIEIDTGFGGGKTHTLLLLHHVFSNPKIGFDYAKKFKLDTEYGIKSIPNVQIATIDCRRISANTLWGEIAKSVGKYDQIKQYDQKNISIKDINVIKSLFDKPTLLMIDELPHYLVKLSHEENGSAAANLTILFLMELISAMASSKNSCLILTLTGRQQLYEGYTQQVKDKIAKKMTDFVADNIHDNIKEAISRQAHVVTPVERNQIYDVVRTRLVKQINEVEKEKTVSEYTQYYLDKGIVVEPEYKEKMLSAYPFHPFLIDTLYERVSTISKFNQTRGMLRLLAKALRVINAEKTPCRLIGTSEITLSNHDIADELTARIDKNLRQVIDADVVRHAKDIDFRKNVKLAESIARTIYLHSLHGHSKKSGIKKSEIKIAVGYPTIDPNLIDKTLEEIERDFWYIKTALNDYYFDEVPNINAIIYEHKKNITDKEIRDELLDALQGLVVNSSGIKSVFWDEHDIEDNDSLKIFVVDPKNTFDSDAIAKAYITQNLEHLPNNSIREKQNTIIFVYADKNGIPSLYDRARTVCAVRKASKDDRIKADKEYETQIKARDGLEKAELKRQCFNVYCRVGYPDGPIPRLDIVSVLDTKSNTISDAVIELLKKKGKIITQLGEDGIPEIADKIKIAKIYESFKTDKAKKFLLDTSSIINAIISGVENSKYGYAESLVESNGKFDAVIGKQVRALYDGWLINKNSVAQTQEPKSEPHVGGQTSFVNPTRYSYKINCNDMDQIIKAINILPIVKMDAKNLDAALDVQLTQGEYTRISIQSNVARNDQVKNLLSSIKTYVTGKGYLTISSDSNLDNTFSKLDVDFTQI